MSHSAVSAIVAILVVLSGCAGVFDTNTGTQPSPETASQTTTDFPAASEIDQSVLEQHMSMLQNTSFTVGFTKSDERPAPGGGTTNQTSHTRMLIDPRNSQYLDQPNGTLQFLGTSQIQAIYSNGTVAYQLEQANNETTVRQFDYRTFNESSDQYLLQSWQKTSWAVGYQFIHSNTTFERVGPETFDGVEVMRYEATGTEALPPEDQGMDGNYGYRDFSMTLLLDEDGIIRYYRAEVDFGAGELLHNRTLVHEVTDVGTTTAETPKWVGNASAGS